MKISYNWLVELTGVDWSPEEMAERLTLAGTACETVIDLGARFQKMIVGEVLAVQPVEGADKVRLARVSTGKAELTILCGAPNVSAGQKVPLALEGAVMPGGLKIGKMKRFGVESQGMIASEKELELSDDHSGIMVLPPETQVGLPLAEALQLNDYSMEFELTPNRADSMCAIGIARDIAALAGTTVRRPEFTLVESDEDILGQLSVEIEDSEFCPRYIGRIIKGVSIGQAPQWMKSRLLACGLTPINNVVDTTNYVMLEYGQPQHAFDLAHFPTGKVVVRRARKGKFVTLDEVEREVDESVLMITNGEEDVAAGGVMGGLKSSISSETKDVLLEAANFDPALIRKSRKKLGLQTDASQRFEKGVDPNITRVAIDRAAQLLGECARGIVLRGAVDNYARKIEPQKVSMRESRMNKVIGADITRERAKEIFTGLELPVEEAGADELVVTAPTFRPDLEREIDLIEEIARIHGIDNIDSSDGYLALYPAQSAESIARENTLERMRNAALACGFDEICGSGLADERLLDALDPGLAQIRVANPVSDEFAVMRNSLSYSLLAAARTNITHQVTSVRVFEIGNIYGPGIAREFHERLTLGLLVSGLVEPYWRGDNRLPLDFYWLKGALERICTESNVTCPEIKTAEFALFNEGESFELVLDGRRVGRVGAVRTEIARRYDIKQSAATLEVDVEELLDKALPDPVYSPISRFPASTRDIALVVDEPTLVGEMLATVKRLSDGLIEDIEVFDVFRGKQVPKGKKSVAISIRYRSSEKSLESSEVDGLQGKIIDYLKREFKADIRDQ